MTAFRKFPKLTIFLAVIMLLLLSCKKKAEEIVIVPDAQKNHLQRNRLLGNVKTQQIETYILTEDSIKKILNSKLFHYSSDGFLTQYLILNEDNDTISERNISYNPNSTENYWIEKEKEAETFRKCQYKYDINGYLAGEQYYANDSLLYTVDYKTDGIGGIVEMKRNFPDYSIRNHYQYNSQGLVVRVDEYDPAGNLYKYITYEYDNYGDEVNRRAFKGKNQLIEYTYSQYDDDGKILKVIYEDCLHSIREIRTYSEHDANGNWGLEIYSRNNKNIYFRKQTITYY